MYPLFKPSATDLGGAAMRVHISVIAGSTLHTPLAPPLKEEEMQLSSSEEEKEDKGPLSIQSPTQVSQSKQHCMSKRHTKSVITNEDAFTATVSVERAMHLSLKGKNKKKSIKCFYWLTCYYTV